MTKFDHSFAVEMGENLMGVVMAKRMSKRATRSPQPKTNGPQHRRDVMNRAASADQGKPTQHFPNTNGSEPLEAVAATRERAAKGPTPFVLWTTMPLQLTSMWWDACERAARKVVAPRH